MNGKILTTVFKSSGPDSSHKKKEHENNSTEAVITEDDREYQSVLNQALEDIDEDLDEDEMEDPLQIEDAHAPEEEEKEEEEEEEKQKEEEEEEEEEDEAGEEEANKQNKEQELQDSGNTPSPRNSGEDGIPQTKSEEYDDEDTNSMSEIEDGAKDTRSPSGAEHDGYIDQNNAKVKEVVMTSGDSADTDGQMDELDEHNSSEARESGEGVYDSTIAKGVQEHLATLDGRIRDHKKL